MAKRRKRLIGITGIAIATLGSALGAQVVSAAGPEILPTPPGIQNAFIKMNDQMKDQTGRGIAYYKMEEPALGLIKIENQFFKFYPAEITEK